MIQRINNPNFEKIFRVFVVQGGTAAAESMTGDYSVDRNQLIFKPRFKLQPGVTYKAVFKLAEETGELVATVPSLSLLLPRSSSESILPPRSSPKTSSSSTFSFRRR
jgi:hypothetical protein